MEEVYIYTLSHNHYSFLDLIDPTYIVIYLYLHLKISTFCLMILFHNINRGFSQLQESTLKSSNTTTHSSSLSIVVLTLQHIVQLIPIKFITFFTWQTHK